MGNLAGWPYWKVISITGQAGSGTDYQVKLEIGDSAGGDFHLEGHCTNFPQDIRITDDDGTTILNYFVEDITADPIIVKVKVNDNLDSNQDIRVYYGKNGETTTSNGSTTFIDFFDKDTTAGWTTGGGLTVTTEGDYLRFYNNVAGNVGTADRSVDTPTKYIVESRFKTIGLGTDQGLFILYDGSDSHRKIATYAPYKNAQNKWYYYVASAIEGGAYTEGTEYIWKFVCDDSNDGSGSSMYLMNTSRAVLSSALNKGTYGTVSDVDGLQIGDGSASAVYDARYRWLYVRKYAATEPTFSSAGAEQSPVTGHPWYYRRNQ